MAQIQVRDSRGGSLDRIYIRFSVGTQSSEEAIWDASTDPHGNTGWPVPYWPDQPYTLHVNQGDFRNPAYGSESRTVEPPFDTESFVLADAATEPEPPIPPVPVPGEYPFPPEEGRLRVEGMTFRRSDGSLFQWRGYSWFLGFLRYCRGEDVTPDLRWMRANGVNIPRLFGPLPWTETPDYRIESFRFDLLDSFLYLLESYGLRSNWSLGHYRDPGLKSFVGEFYDIAQLHPGVVTEFVNEPTVGSEKPDPLGPDFKVDRHGVLAAYGLHAKYYDKDPGLDPVLDFATLHVQRDSSWHRKARHCQEWQHQCGKPVVSDEPAKITEPGFEYPGGKNDPVKTPGEMTWHSGVCGLWTPGCTVHTEEGKWGRTPQPQMLQQTVMTAVLRDVWLKVGAEWQTGEYNHSENHDSPVDDVDTPSGDPVWTYTSLHPDRALSVRCYPSQPRAKNGWSIEEAWGTGGSFVRLSK